MAPEEQKFEEGTYEWFQEQYQKFIFPVEEYKKAVDKMNELQVPKVDPDDGHVFSLAERITFLAFKYNNGKFLSNEELERKMAFGRELIELCDVFKK